MADQYTFRPNRRAGLVFHLGLVLLLSAAIAVSIWAGVKNPALRLAYGLSGLLALSFLMIVFYRLYALWTASYELEADGIHLRWGWRLEDIPMDQVLWLVPATELPLSLPLPPVRWPGSLQGTQHLPAGQSSGLPPTVEFLAANTQGLILIGTPERIFAISPASPAAFLQAYQHLAELGSFNPIPRRSQQPSSLLNRLWVNPPARALVLSGAALSAALLLIANLAVGGRTSIRLGFLPDGAPGEAVPASQLYLLPLLNGVFFLINLVAGLFYFRRSESHPIAFLIWGASLFTGLLILAGMAWALTNV